jgi:hypothetical protein
MSLNYRTELEWMQMRDEALTQGFIMRSDGKYVPLFLDSDRLLNGHDLWLRNGETFVVESWKRQEIASFVSSKIKSQKLEDDLLVIQNFGSWLEEHRSYEENYDQSANNNGASE